ncbi:hypothetical protein FACS1894130_12720 [Spirochaetia bacterium]|nr:hypothetical protein FACS1894130_12720 [Spirochaetia bacterium]
MKRFFSVLLIMALVITVMGCSKQESAGGSAGSRGASKANTKIGVLLPDLGYDFQTKMAAGVKRAADTAGYGFQAIDYNFDSELQLTGMETLAASGVMGYYAIFMNTSEANDNILKSYPKIGVISQVPNVDTQAFIRDDYPAIAEQCIQCLDDFRKKNNLKGGDMAALWLTNSQIEDTQDYETKMILRNIFTAYCEKEGLKFVSDQYPTDEEEASNVIAQLMNAYPDLRYIFCFNNGFAIAASNEISSAVSDVSKYFVFASEGDDESFRLIAATNSPYRGLSYNDIEATGYETGEQLIRWIEKGAIEDVYVSRLLVNSDNITQFVK